MISLRFQLPENESHDLVIETLFECWTIYGEVTSIILFVVPEQEFNIGDQLLIEQGLIQRADDRLIIKHVTMNDLCQHCSLNSQGNLFL